MHYTQAAESTEALPSMSEMKISATQGQGDDLYYTTVLYAS